MRQQTKPFIIETKPSRKPKPDAQKPSIWGRLDADIAHDLQDDGMRITRRPPAVTTVANEPLSGRSLHFRCAAARSCR